MSEIKYTIHKLLLLLLVIVKIKTKTNLFELNLKAYIWQMFLFELFNDIFATLTYIYKYICTKRVV